MPRMCKLCGKIAKTANSRSKSNLATKRTQKPNLHKIKLGNLSVLSCTRCMRTRNKPAHTAAGKKKTTKKEA
ncbi:MAG: 50S ribosomal protein L28 [Parcubacteria group bacterium CG10_big_fil_rev_8_21_14_0_10_41_35]|nr:MAG: 50S ribosomal protein L28 [Parcubacteria group bacterium CG10_big_fil_rev_8_21_14_0_10_41_35]